MTDVLVVTAPDDAHADHLIPRLEAAGLSCARWDPGAVPVSATAGMTLDDGSWSRIEIGDPETPPLDLTQVGVVWYRRPSEGHAPGGSPTQSIADLIDRECAWFFVGLWSVLDRPIVNDPYLGLRASTKPHQLRTARALGFEVPRTYVGNDPRAIRALWRASGGRLIVKGFDPRAVRLPDGSQRLIYTSPVEPGDLEDDAALRACPSIWQEYVSKSLELRVTVVGDRVLTAEIDSQANPRTRHDWRHYDFENTPHRPHTLPGAVAERCRALLRTLGLHYGAIDLILTPDGRLVFLEINPSGQWVWIETLTGLPISEAHVDLFRTLARAGSPKGPRASRKTATSK